MIKSTAQYVRALMLILLSDCIAASASNANDFSNVPARVRSVGCGIPQAGNGKFMPMELRVLNQDRIYHLLVPSKYDPNRAYPLIFRWHGYGGNGLSGGLGIEFSSGNDAIVVGADGLNKSWRTNTDSVDLVFFDRMLETLAERYCIDRDRIFSYGFSAGGFFTNLLACERGDVLRASATVAGAPRGVNCKGKLAAWFLHDQDDNVVPIDVGKAARERVLATNGCSTNTVDEGDGCKRYLGCEATPVVWCETKGYGHNIRGDFAPARVWKFFLNLR